MEPFPLLPLRITVLAGCLTFKAVATGVQSRPRSQPTGWVTDVVSQSDDPHCRCRLIPPALLQSTHAIRDWRGASFLRLLVGTDSANRLISSSDSSHDCSVGSRTHQPSRLSILDTEPNIDRFISHRLKGATLPQPLQDPACLNPWSPDDT